MKAARQPRRLVSRPEHPLAALLQEAAHLEPPDGAHARVLRRLVESVPRRLVEQSTPDDPVVGLLAAVTSPEPTSIQRTRVLRALDSAASRRRWRPGWGAVGLTTAAAMMLLTLSRGEKPTPPVAAASGTASASSTAPHSRHQVLVGIGELMLSSDAQLEVERDHASGVRLKLDSGRLALHAANRQGLEPLVIVALGVEVAVVGTVLAVDAIGPTPIVTVAEGLVEVRHEGAVTQVGAGQRWSDSNQAVTAEASDWAGWAMRQVGSDRTLLLENIRDLPQGRDPSFQSSQRSKPRAVVGAASKPAKKDVHRDSPAARPPVSELSRRVAEARTSFDREAESTWLRALADAPDASPEQRRTSLVELAQLLDDDLARPLDALEVRRRLSQRFTDHRAEASFQIMLATSEFGHPEAKDAIDACLARCADPARSFARFLFARQLQLDGRLTQAQTAMDDALRDATALGGTERLAELFFLRGRHFLHRGQIERAQGAASLCRAFDREGIHTAQLRKLGL